MAVIVTAVRDDASRADYPYRQLAAALRARIASGEIERQLPTIASLAETYGVAPKTVQRALKVLKDDGTVYGIDGLGVFVTGQ